MQLSILSLKLPWGAQISSQALVTNANVIQCCHLYLPLVVSNAVRVEDSEVGRPPASICNILYNFFSPSCYEKHDRMDYLLCSQRFRAFEQSQLLLSNVNQLGSSCRRLCTGDGSDLRSWNPSCFDSFAACASLGIYFFLFQWWKQRGIDHQDLLEANGSVSSRVEVRNKAVAINLWVFKHCKMETTPTFPGKNLKTSANSMEKEYIMYWLLFRKGERCKSPGGETLDVVVQFRQGRSQQTWADCSIFCQWVYFH